MSSFNSVSYSGNTPANTIEHRQRPSSPLPPKDSLFQHAHPQHLHHDQHQRPHQQQQQEAHYPHLQHEYPYSHQQRDICEMQRNVNLLPNAGKKLTLARIEGEDEELEVIGNGINGSFESRSSKSRLLMRLPNLKYNYPEASVQNFSPGTSLIFNAFKGHGGLLTQPYMEDTYESTNDNANRRILNPLSQEADVEQDSRQRVIFEQRGSNSYSPYHHQRTLEHSPYRAPHEHQFHPYQINGHSGELKDHRDYREPRDARGYSDLRERGSPRNRPAQRSPGMASSSATAPPESAGPSAAPIEQGYDSRNRISNHRIAEYHEHLRSRGDFPPFPPSQAPQHTMLDPAHIIAPSHPTQPASQYWDKRNSDLPDAARPYERNNSSGSINSRNPLFQPVPQQRQPVDTWEGPPDHQPPYATPAIDIPLPRNQGSVNYAGDFDHRDSVDSGMQDRQDRQHQFYMQQPQPSMAGGSMGSPGFRAPFSPRTAGPRYSFSRINYRMIFEYASEIRECLIKGKVGTTDRLLYNAEILSKVFMGCRSDVDPNAPAEEETQALNPHQLRCTSCNIVKTPEWRKGPLGPRTLCNACGLSKHSSHFGITRDEHGYCAPYSPRGLLAFFVW
ncbi:hypothetical protein BC939DRAFT_313023 [Gamsiella multidivaricata]|uniref:uncharacterized protein n=1 Tax=Gamsiella multidivaricata TaxID=101098 RepID=UPI00221E7352|nr:uncharacterized protein BC939DRAFT_313023 [Gamsiella multidivaricata]KAI7817868.1 hypothetical protein BC939DRAFT_313023 [Gamsiella multidivaricata]